MSRESHTKAFVQMSAAILAAMKDAAPEIGIDMAERCVIESATAVMVGRAAAHGLHLVQAKAVFLSACADAWDLNAGAFNEAVKS
jgi:hypothetical protein